MTPPDIFYSTLLFVSGIVCFIVGSIVAQRRPVVSGAISLTVLLISLSWWDLTYAIFWAGTRGPSPLFWLDLTYFGVVIVPTAFMTFAMEICGLRHWLKRPFLLTLCIMPSLVIATLWTDSWHGLFFAGKRVLNSGMILDAGPVFWANIAYSYILLLIGFILLIRRYRQTTGVYRRQIGMVIAGAGITWLNSIVFVLGWSPFPNADNTPFSFTLAGLAFVYALMRYHLLDILPIARDVLIEKMRDGVVVIDANNRVVDINPAAEEILGFPANSKIGQPVETVFSAWSDIIEAFLDVNSVHAEVPVGDPIRGYLDLEITALFDHKQNIGRLVVWRDITNLKQIQAELEKLAIQDSLTLLHNRRHFYTLAEREIIRAVRLQSLCSIVLIDIDFFKRINDTYGHQSGDHALVSFARTCQENIRQMDILARLGGEEFVILLPGTNLQQAEETAGRIRKIVNDTTIETEGGDFKISASFGVSIFEFEHDTLDSLFKKADQALYHAKKSGRNHITVWNENLMEIRNL